MHIHLQYLVSESVLQKCLHVCKREIAYLSLPSVRPFHIFNHGCQSSLDHPGFHHHFFFPLYSIFHTALRITFVKSKYSPGPACLKISVLLLPIGFLRSFLPLLSAVCLFLLHEGHVPATLNSCPNKPDIGKGQPFYHS